MKSRLFSVIIVLVFIMPCSVSAQFGWLNFGDAVSQKAVQGEKSSVTSFNPDFEIGFRAPFDGDAAVEDWEGWIGIGFATDLRVINIDGFEWSKQKSYKCVFDLYGGPSIMLPFYDEPLVGLLINCFLGYSFSGGGLSSTTAQNARIGDFTVKINAQMLFSRFMVGVAWRPLRQHLETYSGNTLVGIDIDPAIEVRLGYLFAF